MTKQRTALQAAVVRQRLSQNLKQQRTIGRALIRFRGPFVMGWLHLRYAQCRKGGCQCTKGRPHGPFLYATLRVKGRNVYRYVGKADDASLVRRIKNYQEFRQKLADFRKLVRGIDADWNHLEKSFTSPYSN